MNAKLSPHRVWPCHENGLIQTIQMIPYNLYVSFKLTSLLVWIKAYYWFILIHSKGKMP